MRLSPRKNGLTSLFKEVWVFKVVLHGHSADGRASFQAAAHSSKVVSSASSFNIGPSYTRPKKGGSRVVRVIASELILEQQNCVMHFALDITQPKELIPEYFFGACNVLGYYGKVIFCLAGYLYYCKITFRDPPKDPLEQT